MSTFSANDLRAGRNQGEVYYLPRAVLVARLVASPTQGLSVVIDQPDIIADTGAKLFQLDGVQPPALPAGCAPLRPERERYILSHRISGFHKDTISIQTEKSLLKSVMADTEEQTTEALANLVKSVASLKAESGPITDGEVLVELRFDPTDCAEVVAVEAAMRHAIDSDGMRRLKEMSAAGGNAGPLAKLRFDAPPPSNLKLGLSGYSPFRLPKGPADCRLGVCVPVQVPASLVIEMGGRRRESPVMYLPNQSDPVAIPVSRSGFADVKTTLALDRGILTKRDVVRTSEVAAILLLPATLVSAYLDQLSSTFKKRKTVTEDELALRKAQREAREQPESGDLATNDALLHFPLPGLSVGGVVKASTVSQVQPKTNDAIPPAGKQTQQGDGAAAKTVEKANADGTK